MNSGLVNFPLFTKATSQKKGEKIGKKRGWMGWRLEIAHFHLKVIALLIGRVSKLPTRSSHRWRKPVFAERCFQRAGVCGQVRRRTSSRSYRSASRRISSRFCLLSSRRRSKSISSMTVTCKGRRDIVEHDSILRKETRTNNE